MKASFVEKSNCVSLFIRDERGSVVLIHTDRFPHQSLIPGGTPASATPRLRPNSWQGDLEPPIVEA